MAQNFNWSKFLKVTIITFSFSKGISLAAFRGALPLFIHILCGLGLGGP